MNDLVIMQISTLIQNASCCDNASLDRAMVLGKTACATINFKKLTLLKSTCHMLDIMVRNQMQHLKDASSSRHSVLTKLVDS